MINTNSVTFRVTQPHNCLLAVALPLTKDDFLKDLNSDCEKDYAKSRMRKFRLHENALWEFDHKPLVDFLHEVMTELGTIGVAVINSFSKKDIDAIEKFDVFTLVAHWDDKLNKVELFDGLITCNELSSVIPKQFKGIFDLTVCNSLSLQRELKKSHSNVVIANTKITSLEFRMTVYKHCQKILAGENINFMDALVKVRKEILNINLD